MSAYLNTRVSLYSERLWRDEHYAALLRAALPDIPGTLVENGLKDLANIVPGNDLRSLEQTIIARLLEETLVLIRPLTGEARAFLTYWTERFEVTNLKALLRGKMTGDRPAALIARLTPMGAFGHLDIHELAHAEDVSELLRRMEAGHYAGIVRNARRAFEESHDPFILDAALDRAYYEGLARRAQPMESEAGQPFKRLMAGLIDRINLVWLLRYRFNYNLPPAQVYFLLVGSRYSLPSKHLRELAALGSMEDVLAALPERMAALLAGVNDIPEVFQRMERAAAATALGVLHSGAPPMARAFAYLLLRERDLRAVRAVLRGRQLGLSVPDMRTAMYLPAEGNA